MICNELDPCCNFLYFVPVLLSSLLDRTLAVKLYARFKGRCADLPPLLELLEAGRDTVGFVAVLLSSLSVQSNQNCGELGETGFVTVCSLQTEIISLEDRWGFPQRLWPLLWAQLRRESSGPLKPIGGVQAGLTDRGRGRDL